MSAPKNNTFAKKPASERASTHLHQRANPGDKRKWKAAARVAGVSFSEWVSTVLNKAAAK